MCVWGNWFAQELSRFHLARRTKEKLSDVVIDMLRDILIKQALITWPQRQGASPGWLFAVGVSRSWDRKESLNYYAMASMHGSAYHWRLFRVVIDKQSAIPLDQFPSTEKQSENKRSTTPCNQPSYPYSRHIRQVYALKPSFIDNYIGIWAFQ